jgi:hypothetical protein
MSSREHRRARNEFLFREVNERIEEISGDWSHPIDFICECASEECLDGDDDGIVLPVGSTEQHAYLSWRLNILAERATIEAAEPLGVPVLPVFLSARKHQSRADLRKACRTSLSGMSFARGGRTRSQRRLIRSTTTPHGRKTSRGHASLR